MGLSALRYGRFVFQTGSLRFYLLCLKPGALRKEQRFNSFKFILFSFEVYLRIGDARPARHPKGVFHRRRVAAKVCRRVRPVRDWQNGESAASKFVNFRMSIRKSETARAVVIGSRQIIPLRRRSVRVGISLQVAI